MHPSLPHQLRPVRFEPLSPAVATVLEGINEVAHIAEPRSDRVTSCQRGCGKPLVRGPSIAVGPKMHEPLPVVVGSDGIGFAQSPGGDPTRLAPQSKDLMLVPDNLPVAVPLADPLTARVDGRLVGDLGVMGGNNRIVEG